MNSAEAFWLEVPRGHKRSDLLSLNPWHVLPETEFSRLRSIVEAEIV